MKNLIIILSCMLLPCTIQAQAFEYPEYEDSNEKIAVKYKGNRPTITDFANTYLNKHKEEEFHGMVYREWLNYQQNKPLSKHASIILDTKNGYMHYEIMRPEEKDTMVFEMCYWNCADGKHKLICANTVWMLEGDYGWNEEVGPWFYLYDNATKAMRTIFAEDIGALYDGDGLSVFFLPRKGKNIKVSAAGGGERWDEELEWDGYQFISRSSEDER